MRWRSIKLLYTGWFHLLFNPAKLCWSKAAAALLRSQQISHVAGSWKSIIISGATPDLCNSVCKHKSNLCFRSHKVRCVCRAVGHSFLQWQFISSWLTCIQRLLSSRSLLHLAKNSFFIDRLLFVPTYRQQWCRNISWLINLLLAVSVKQM